MFDGFWKKLLKCRHSIRAGEAGAVLGLGKLPSKPKLWEWFYTAADMKKPELLLNDYFRHQIRAGMVGTWLWFIDGHLLPYSGKEKVHYSYNTQRRMPMPGRTNLVTCDISGRIVNFDIQEQAVQRLLQRTVLTRRC